VALNPVNPIESASATATNGSPTISVTGSVDCSFIVPGFVLQLGTRRIVTAISGTAPVSGTSTITLSSNWDQPTTTDKLIGWNSYESLPNIVNRIQNALANQTAIGELSTTGLIERTGPNAFSTVSVTTYGKSLINTADAAAARTTLGAQASDATLAALAGLTVAANKGIYATGADAFATYDMTAFSRSLGAAADAPALRALAGLQASVFESIKLRATVFSRFEMNEYALYEATGTTPKELSDIWTITRAGDSTYNSPIGIKTATANQPRIEYDSATGRSLGLLCEASRTRLNTISALPTAAENVTVTAAAHTVSFYGAGSVALSGTHTATLVGTGAGQRVQLAFTPTAGTLTLTPSGSVVDLQLEAGSGATSIIRGEGSQQTRVFTQQSRTITDLFNKAGSTIVVDFRPDMLSNSSINGFFGAGASASNAITLAYVANTALVRCRWYAGGAQIQIDSAAASAPLNQLCRAAITFDSSGNFRLAVNGIYAGAAVSDIPNTAAWTEYWLGALRTKTDNPIGRATVSLAAIIPRTSTQAELTELSKL